MTKEKGVGCTYVQGVGLWGERIREERSIHMSFSKTTGRVRVRTRTERIVNQCKEVRFSRLPRSSKYGGNRWNWGGESSVIPEETTHQEDNETDKRNTLLESVEKGSNVWVLGRAKGVFTCSPSFSSSFWDPLLSVWGELFLPPLNVLYPICHVHFDVPYRDTLSLRRPGRPTFRHPFRWYYNEGSTFFPSPLGSSILNCVFLMWQPYMWVHLSS